LLIINKQKLKKMTKLRNLLAIHELNIKTLCSYERTAEMTNYSLDLYNLQMQKQKVKDIEDEILDLFKAPKITSEEQALLNLSDFLATQIDKLNSLKSDIEDEEDEEEEEQEMSAADKEEERGIAAFEDDRQSNWD
jgi:uncharacterized protein YutE (UPF0331/DUF86 family)